MRHEAQELAGVYVFSTRKQMTDYSTISPRHEAINLRLEEWGRWVRVTPRVWPIQPMFRMYQSKARQWETDPVIHVEVDQIAAHEVEKEVSKLPVHHRTALRWCYVWPYVPDRVVRQEVGATRSALAQLLNSARDMLDNTLK